MSVLTDYAYMSRVLPHADACIMAKVLTESAKQLAEPPIGTWNGKHISMVSVTYREHGYVSHTMGVTPVTQDDLVHFAALLIREAVRLHKLEHP